MGTLGHKRHFANSFTHFIPISKKEAMAIVQTMKSSLSRLPQIISRSVSRPSPSTSIRNASTLDISGMFPPIPTPFNADESIAFDKLEFNIKKWNKIPLRGYVVQGSTGEYAFLTSEERVEIVKRVKEMASPDKLIIAGSGCESTKGTIKMTQKMAEAGAAAVLVVTPCYYKASMSNQALFAHYTKIADSSPVPILLYSVPGNTSLDLDAEVIIRLASHPNIIGLKDSGGDITKLGLMAYKTKDEDFKILAGSAGFLMPGYAVGCLGGVCGLANILGEELCTLADLFFKGNLKEALPLHQRLIGPNTCVTRQFGLAGLKAAMDDFGYYGGPTRLPILPLTEAQLTTQRQVFKSSGFM